MVFNHLPNVLDVELLHITCLLIANFGILVKHELFVLHLTFWQFESHFDH